jgi:tRNA pseudouridine32 synthase/23S rRNA pseudouridine746 synthase
MNVDGKTTTDTAAIGAVLAYGASHNRLVPGKARMPANLVAAAVATGVVYLSGASWDDLGLSPLQWRRGVRTGVGVSVPIVASMGVLAATPATRRHFADPRVTEAPNPLFEAALRIPIGTALCEELIFRSALLALLERHGSARRAVALSSLTFGLWHIFPALDALRATEDPEHPPSVPPLASVVITIAATTVAGVAFAWMRKRSRSVLAPVIVHGTINGSSFVAARLLHARAQRRS